MASAVGASAVVLLAANDSPTGLDGVRARGELVVALREGPASYYTNSFGAAGFEYALAQAYARELGVDLRVIDVTSPEEALEAVADGDADFAGGLALAGNDPQFSQSVPVQQVTQLVVCEAIRGQAMPAKVADLTNRLLVIAGGSHHAARLAQLDTLVPELAWQEIDEASDENLLGLVHQDQAECTVIDANAWAFHRHLYPDLRVAMELPEATFFGWIFPHSVDDSLRESANAWLARKHADGTVASLRDRHFAHLKSLTQVDGKHFYQAIRKRLPRYVEAFRAEAERNDLDWRLLAAVAYQESMWDPAAQSPTGVQGLMQLTLDTAAHLGIADRTDPLSSIRGGARYLRQILDTLPADIPEEDRTWMALAAYNAGIAHVLDARELTRKRGGNPNAWHDVRANLALLKQEKWYSQTRYGYARGATQAIVYVRHVRRYYDLLVLASNSSSHDEIMLAMGDTPTTLAAN
ncbi:MAG: membrane-bound lytic murein transglycosylase MltF [Pseudomonadota bacterium]